MSEIPQDLAEQLRYVKTGLRGLMNGTVSQSMRDKGLNYKVIFGVELPRLYDMSAELPHTAELAGALWKENIRECRILATMLYPVKDFFEDLADLWVEQMHYTEEAEVTVMYLFQHLPYASQKAFEWIAREEEMFQLCGWLLMGRLLMKGMAPTDRDADELLDQLSVALRSSHLPVKLAAHKALLKYMDQGEEEEKRGEKVLDDFERQLVADTEEKESK